MARSANKDVLEKFRFGVSWGAADNDAELYINTGNAKTGLIRAGFHDVQVPKRATNVMTYREGTDRDVMSKSAGLSTFEDIVLSRGLLSGTEATKELMAWSRLVHDSSVGQTFGFEGGGAAARTASGSQNYRKDVYIWMYDRSGRIVRAWKLYNAFPSNYVAGSDLNAAEDGEKSLEQLTLAYEDFIELLADGSATVPAGDVVANA